MPEPPRFEAPDPPPGFPDDFVWGVATSAFQIEGATDADGRGESIWDRFCATPGTISDGSDGRRACEHYTRWPEDIRLMRDLGVGAYRFSIAWPRVIPAGRGPVNAAGLDFYDRLVDGLLEAGIRPFATLYHWDLPQPLQDAGGWAARHTAVAFAHYADAVTRRLGDRVASWATHNEPWCIAILGHEIGEHAPGHKSGAEALAAAHHVLLSHGWSVPVIRDNAPGAEVGIVLNAMPVHPASPSKHDVDAARRLDGTFNRWFLDPLYGRGYPKDVVADRRAAGDLPTSGPLPFVRGGDMDVIARPTDFLGINYYSRAIARSRAIPESANYPRVLQVPRPDACTDMGWEIFPAGLTELLRRVNGGWGPEKIYVTECGAAFATGPSDDGAVRDERRVAFLREHFRAAEAAIDLGVRLAGFFVWSLLDNFEWAHGYTKRFGITWVDYDTQQRTLKASGHFYRDVIEAGGLPDELEGPGSS